MCCLRTHVSRGLELIHVASQYCSILYYKAYLGWNADFSTQTEWPVVLPFMVWMQSIKSPESGNGLTRSGAVVDLAMSADEITGL